MPATAEFFLDTLDEVSLRNCEVVWAGRPEFVGHAVEAVDVRGPVIEGMRSTSGHPEQVGAVLRRERGHGDVPTW